MSNEIGVAHVQGWHNGFYSLAQQRQSRFERYVRIDGELKGKWAWFNRLGKIEMVERTSRHQDTNIIDNPHSRRGCSMKDYEVGDFIDKQDLHRLIDDPQNSYIRNAVWASNRNKDTIILKAVNGVAVSADADDSQTSNTLPADQKIVVGGTGLTLAKLRDARKILHASEVLMEEDEGELPFAVSAQQMDDLLGITEIKSIEYNEDKPGVKGRVARYMGFVFIETERLSTDASSSRLCVAWKPSAMGFRGPGGDPETSVDKRPDKGNSIQVLAQQTAGAVRIEDVGVVQVACAE